MHFPPSRHRSDQLRRTLFIALLMGGFSQSSGLAQQTTSPPPPPPRSQPTLISPTHPSIVNGSDYILGAGDQVAITVIGFEEFDGSRVILPDGTITLPLIGAVSAAGQTMDSLAATLTVRLRRFLVEPVLSVSLTALRPVIVNVAGEVYRPGPVQLSSLTNASTRINDNARITTAANSPTLSAALLAAGGVKREADIRRITVKRTLPGGRNETIAINLWDAITNSNAPNDEVVLRAGDAVFVPRVLEGNELDPQLVASSTLAPATVRVRVVGEVNRPGEVQVSPNSSISSAVAIAGGPTEDARLKDVALVRIQEGGQVEEQVVDIRNLVDDYQVQDGDVIFVPKSTLPSLLDGVNRFISPINLILNILRL